MTAIARNLREIQADIRSLRPRQRAELLRRLVAELDGPPDADVAQAWLEVVKRRQKEIAEKKVKVVPGDQVFKRLKSRLKR